MESGVSHIVVNDIFGFICANSVTAPEAHRADCSIAYATSSACLIRQAKLDTQQALLFGQQRNAGSRSRHVAFRCQPITASRYVLDQTSVFAECFA